MSEPTEAAAQAAVDAVMEALPEFEDELAQTGCLVFDVTLESQGEST